MHSLVSHVWCATSQKKKENVWQIMPDFYLPFPRDSEKPETAKIAEVIRSNLNPSALAHTFRRLTFIKRNEGTSTSPGTSSNHKQHPAFLCSFSVQHAVPPRQL